MVCKAPFPNDCCATAEACAQVMNLHPYCGACGWRKSGVDSWDGIRCKCGHREPPYGCMAGKFSGFIQSEIARGASPAIVTNPHIRNLMGTE